MDNILMISVMFLRVLLLYLIGLLEGTSANHASDFPCTSLNCAFDTGFCCWTPSRGYNAQWQRYIDATSAGSSGHSKDHTTRNGDFISTLLDVDDAQVALISPYTNGGTYCLSVWYKISGSDVALQVYTQYRKTRTYAYETKFQTSYGNMWQNSLIQIHSGGSFRIVLQAKSETIIQKGEISVDDVSVTKTTCPLDCSFNSGLCAWQILYTNDNVVYWSRTAHSNGKDHYLHTTAYEHSAGKAVLRSSWQTPGPQCLSIHFHMFGIGANSLNVFIERSRIHKEQILSVFDKTVKEVNVTLNLTDYYKVILVGDVQQGEGEDIYIDNIASISGPCTKDCNPSPCLNGATCVQTSTDITYECVCSKGWTGKHCTENLSPTEVPSTAGSELPTTNASTKSKDDPEEIPNEPKSPPLYIVIASVGAACLLIVGAVVFLVILLRNRRRKRRLYSDDNRQLHADNTIEMAEANAYELNESMNESGAENHDDGLLHTEDENGYSEAHACDSPETKTEENVYNHLNQTMPKTILDQTYSHIPNGKPKDSIADQTYSHIPNAKPKESIVDQTYSHIPNAKQKEYIVDQTYSHIPNAKPKESIVDQTYSHIPNAKSKESVVDQTYSHIPNAK